VPRQPRCRVGAPDARLRRQQTLQPRVLAVNDVMLGSRLCCVGSGQPRPAGTGAGAARACRAGGPDGARSGAGQSRHERARRDGGRRHIDAAHRRAGVGPRAGPTASRRSPPVATCCWKWKTPASAFRLRYCPHISNRSSRRGGRPAAAAMGWRLCMAIVRHCDGFVAVESAPGQGTRMRVTCPVAGCRGPCAGAGGKRGGRCEAAGPRFPRAARAATRCGAAGR